VGGSYGDDDRGGVWRVSDVAEHVVSCRIFHVFVSVVQHSMRQVQARFGVGGSNDTARCERDSIGHC
jgi:hypothetical protein